MECRTASAHVVQVGQAPQPGDRESRGGEWIRRRGPERGVRIAGSP